MGRPSIKTPELLAAICERLAVGESVRSICRSEDMPTDCAVFRWLATDVAFQKQYLQAKEVGCFVLAALMVAEVMFVTRLLRSGKSVSEMLAQFQQRLQRPRQQRSFL